MRNNQKLQNNKVVLLSTIILLVIIIMTIGYAAFSDQLTITDTVAHVRAYKLVRINGVSTASGSVSNLDYDSDSILNTVSIPAGESVTYSVTATNLDYIPVAVSAVSFTNGNSTVSNLSANIPSNSNGYLKICDTNDVCTGGVSKTFDITITNTGSSTISTNLDVNLTFTEVYDISYEGNKIGEALAGSTYTKTFDAPAPTKLSKTSGDCDSYTYSNGTLTVINVESNLEFTEAHTVTYNGEVQGYINDGGTYTYPFESKWPATVEKTSGTADSFNYNKENHTITITNVKSNIELTGTIGKVEITRIEYVEGSAKNVLENPPTQPTFRDMDANFSVTFQRPEGSTETDFEITYEVDVSNSHYDDYIFRGFDFHPTIQASADSDAATLTLIPTGIANGDKIASGTTKTFTVTLKLETNNPDGNYGTSSSTQVDTTPDTEEETGEVTATINETTGDLRSQDGKNTTLAPFTLNVTNTYKGERDFKLSLSNSNLEVVNCNGNALENLSINGDTTAEPYQICIHAVNGAKFLENTTTTNIFIGTPGNANVLVSSLTLNVDIYDVPDTTPITVGNVQISMHRNSANAAPTTGQIDVTWDRIDVGGDQVTDYVVQLYNSSNTLVSTGHTNSATRSYSFTDVADGTYKAVVYGIDAHPNSGESSASASTGTSNGYASASSATSFEWRFNVSVTAQNLTITGNGTDVALLEQSHTVTVKASGKDSNNNDYIVADTVEVIMGGKTLTISTDYTFTRSNNNKTGTIVIKKVTGNIEVGAARTTSGGGTCLIQGTKVLLANGQYKNIENINYEDLMLTYSYETGKFVPEYPIWIEKGKFTNNYQLNTFSDGTILKTYGYHGLYETELKRFVSVDNPDEFHVGSKIAKTNSDGTGFTEVTVTNIEKKYENVYYYQIASTRYFNFIANGLLTTDGVVEMSNVYGFNDNITWNKDKREEMLKDTFTYEELSDYLPYYMFKGLRAEEAKGLINSGYDINSFVNFVKLLTEDNMLRNPIQQFGKNMWMVTTSEDNVTDLNKNNYLRYEGTEYTVPKPKDKNIVGWLNTSDNTIYQPGDNVTVYHGMHFEAIYK